MVNIPLLILCVILSVFAVASAASPEDECGITDYPGHHVGERIIDGTEVPQGKYPWLVNLQIKDTPRSSCTATIVSKKWILTAAHCIKGFEDGMTVSVGSVDDSKGKSIKVKRCIPHEESPPAHLSGVNDIGLLELEEELTYSKDIRRICLKSKRQEVDPNKNVVITGWGDLTGLGAYPNILHEGTARVVADSICQSDYPTIYNSERMVCVASHNHTIPYTGDSGGPGLMNLEGHWTQIGVCDYVFHPPNLAIPSGYARVSYFCDWIATKTDNDVRCDK